MKKRTEFFLNQRYLYCQYSDLKMSISFDMKKKLGRGFGVINIFYKDFIESIINISVNERLKKILEILLRIEEGADDPPSRLMFCLDESDKLRRELLNKYASFLEKKERDLMERKIAIIEKDIKSKIITYRINMMANMKQVVSSSPQYDYDDVEERHHRR